jgi:hypothetical protein
MDTQAAVMSSSSVEVRSGALDGRSPAGTVEFVGNANLRAALLQRYPWLGATELGPQAVEAGECDRCGAEARLVAPCGPPPDDAPGRVGPDWALGRRCALELGPDGWCGGHEAEAGDALEWLGALPDEADDVARLWWVATGEVRVDPAILGSARRLALPLEG